MEHRSTSQKFAPNSINTTALYHFSVAVWHVWPQRFKPHFLYTIQILGWHILSQKVQNFWKHKICNIVVKANKDNQKDTLNHIEIHCYLTKYTIKVILPSFPRTFNPKKEKLWQQIDFTTKYNFTQTMRASHHPGWCGWWHLASLIWILHTGDTESLNVCR